ncbi:MAG TPA: MurT ligase domain-containing protein [Acidimicrobiales bacterium]|nr:MurT ligase domain-containing protein [Acidimicrobiales bacterium]
MIVDSRSDRQVLPVRAAVAAEAVTMSNRLSRALGRGSGTVVGGRIGLAIDPRLLVTLAEGRRVALVTGTNGKTTTTRMLATALAASEGLLVVSNHTGANMPAGHVAAMVGSTREVPAVLEVDEGYLGRVMADTGPRTVVLLNLSRDQLDRISEVRMLADRWREALGSPGRTTAGGSPPAVVANADDPMVVYAASAAAGVHWVGAGQAWRNDAVGCPSCGGRIVFDDTGRKGPDGANGADGADGAIGADGADPADGADGSDPADGAQAGQGGHGGHGGWSCERCGLSRPRCVAWVDGSVLALADGSRYSLDIGLPGQFNRSNAAMAAVAAALTEGEGAQDGLGWSRGVSRAVDHIARVREVAGRFSHVSRRGRAVRLLLAKNPAGWTAIFDLLDEGGQTCEPVVLSVNARIADGLDTSWLWDVPFERLAGRVALATGDRRLDLAVRLRYAGVECTVVADPVAAIDRAIDCTQQTAPHAAIDFLGNYTAFADMRSRL